MSFKAVLGVNDVENNSWIFLLKILKHIQWILYNLFYEQNYLIKNY